MTNQNYFDGGGCHSLLIDALHKAAERGHV